MNLIMFWHGAVKSTIKWMVELPNIVCRLVGIGAFARTVSQGGIYHPICDWLAFGIWILWTLKVGRVGVKVGLKHPSSARLMLQDLAHLAL